ncbi:MAG TPA: insulinase family protein, partial [Bacteroidales bacterium]|nr:insulinase family protein [Bacteroidales bacterium]
KTIPSSDNGVAHITEHSVLNGSKKFPTKSPFDILSKGSLNTFMNALTSRDATAYPFASMNEKDYFNLMDVYLDAVLNPLIYSDDRILQQEGWHYELNSMDEPVILKGVVYNEMKGAFSNPQRDLYYQILKNVYPQSVYGLESGGTPAAIPTLTQEQFEAFHKKFYHPENSYIFLYGNADLDKELAFIDKNYLSQFTRTGNVSEVTDQPDYSAPKDIIEYYPVMEGNTENQTFLTMSFLAGKNTDYTLGMALNILCEVLINQESAPVRQALQQAGIGQDVTAFAQDNKQNMLTIWAMNANPQDKERFSSIVLNTLKDVIAKGIDKDEIDGVLSRMEFQVKEGSDAQKGITYMNQIQAGWFYASNPFMGLEYNKRLETLRANLKTDYYEGLVERYILNSKNRVLLTFAPKVGLDKERTAQVEKELADYKASLTDKQKSDLIEATKNLIAYQNAEDTP